MRKKIVELFTLVLVIEVVLFYALVTSSGNNDNFGCYEKSFVRNFNSPDEEHAVLVVENVNYVDIFNVTRLTGLNFSTFDNSTDFSEYTWAQVIDSQVLDYYTARFKNLTGTAKSINYTYTALAHTWSQIRVVHIPKSENVSLDDNSVRILGLNGTVLLQESGWATEYAVLSGAGYLRVNAVGVDFNLTKGYVVEMDLNYNEYYWSLAAFNTHVVQTVVLDENFVPQLICVHSSNVIS